MFSQKPGHSRRSRAADGFRTFAVAYQDVPVDYAGRRPLSVMAFDPFTVKGDEDSAPHDRGCHPGAVHVDADLRGGPLVRRGALAGGNGTPWVGAGGPVPGLFGVWVIKRDTAD